MHSAPKLRMAMTERRIASKKLSMQIEVISGLFNFGKTISTNRMMIKERTRSIILVASRQQWPFFLS